VRGGDGEALRGEAGFRGTPRLSTVTSTAGPFWPSSIANALAQIFWVMPSDSARRKPKPLNRTGNPGVTSTAAAPMRHPARASVGNNDAMDSAAMNKSDFMIGSLAVAEYGGQPALGQAEIIWQRRILGLTAAKWQGYVAPAFHLWIKPKTNQRYE